MNPYAYNPYAQQYPGQRGWNPAYGGNMYGAPNAMYYQQQGPPHTQQPQSQPGPNTGAPQPAAVPAPRPKKALVITDKDGNPIDLSSVKKSSNSASAPAPAATASSDAGSKLRQAALERLQGDAKKKEEAAAEVKKEEVKKDPEVEKKEEVAKEKEENPAEPEKPKPSSLSAMLTKQEEGKKAIAVTPEPEEPAEEPEPVPVPSASTSSNGKKRYVYSKEELMRLKSLPVCTKRPDDLMEFDIIKGPSRGGGDRHQRNEGGSSWQRGAAPPRRSSTDRENKGGGGGGQWARGQAPPPKPQGRGGGRGGRGGRGQGPIFDGPVAPLVKSKNGWRPKKNTSALVVAEKQVKAILNKMTKEKFDRLSAQMCEIPVLSYEILTMMIGNVYEKAIDEPTFGDMYGDLCVKLSQRVQTDSFVHIIQSDEEPPTEDEEASPEADSGQSSHNLTYRWSNDVSTNDAEVVGPFQSEEECFEIALSDTEQDRVERGEMELELVKLQIKGGMFIKVLRKKTSPEAEEGEEPEFYTVYFPVANHKECGQQLSKIFLSEPECASDASKQNSFKRTLLNKCEDEFNKQDIYVDWKKEKAAYEETKSKLTEAERAEKEEELDFRRIKIKKQMLGNIKFIGQLYKKNLLKEKIMRFCIASLLKLEPDDPHSKLPQYHDTGDKEMDEEDHEAICNMFGTIGSTIDGPSTANFMKVCFDKIKRLSTSKDLPSRSRFMYKDLLDLRDNKWIPRRKTEKAKTIEEIRKDFEREERLKAQQSQQMSSNFRGGSNFGRNDNRRGSDFKPTNRSSNFGSGSRRQSSKPVTETDDDGFTTIKSGKSSLSQAASSSRAPQRQAPKIVTKQAFAALADDQPAASNSKPAPEPLSDDKLERRVGTIRAEFMQDPDNIDELLLSVDELAGTPEWGRKLVSKNCDRIIDCKDDERSAIYKLHAILVEKDRLSSEDVKEGMIDLIEFIDSYVYDAPRAFDYLGELLTSMIKVKAVDMPYICEQAAKTKMSSDENPGKIIDALANAMKNGMGASDAKSVLTAHESTVSELVGAEKWASIKGSL